LLVGHLLCGQLIASALLIGLAFSLTLTSGSSLLVRQYLYG